MSKEKSVHKQLVEFFSDTALRARGFRPKISPADAMRLKQILSEDILTHSQLEQIMLYFLADRRFKNLGPSIATMFSSTILNALRNHAINGEQFYKELEQYRERYIKQAVQLHEKLSPREGGMRPFIKTGPVLLADKLKKLAEAMSMRVKSKPRSEPAKVDRAGPVGMF